MWTKTENSESVKPAEIEFAGEHVIIRRNFVFVEATDDKQDHWEWEEWQLTKDQYEVYRQLEPIISEQSDALIELAGLISEVID